MTTNGSTDSVKPLAYRPEIDGLRALALVPVMLFHAGFEWFRGGYVGVDVFFVISGYLIAANIIEEKRRGMFSLSSFYVRRARRILPALVCVVLICLPFAWLWMMPRQLHSFFQSLVAVALFASNVWFARSSGYFDLAAEQKPLLHTWSLGVEEQYYALFPLCVVALWRFGLGTLAWVTAAIAMVSLGFCQWGWPNDSAARFYLAPTRIWELLMGCLLAYYVSAETEISGAGAQIPSWTGTRTSGALAGFGLLLIACSIAILDQSTPFPSFYALAPTVGAALIIYFGRRGTLVWRLLSLKGFVGLGLVSYSAYLWHQPLLAFARLYSSEQLSSVLVAGLLVAAIVLAYPTWRYVERPFRDRQLLSARSVLLFSASGTLAIALIGAIGYQGNGFFGRMSREQLARYKNISEAVASAEVRFEYDCRYAALEANVDAAFLQRFEQCYRKYGAAVLVLGDSHAMDLFGALVQSSARPHVVVITKGCRGKKSQQACYAPAIDFARAHKGKIAVVFYTQKGGYLVRRHRDPAIDDGAIQETQALLRAVASYVPVVWLGPQAEPGIDLRNINILVGGGQPMDARSENRAIGLLDERLTEVNRGQSFRYISKLKLVDFDFERDFVVGGKYTYSDASHWSMVGEKHFGARLLDDPLIASYLGAR